VRGDVSEVTGVLDALRGYVQLATGLTEVTVAKAREAAAALLSQGLDLDRVPVVPGRDSAVSAATVAASQVQGLADDLLETSKANRELLTGLVRTEVDRAAGRLGFVREEELAAVRRHVSRLETQLAEVRAQIGAGIVVPRPAGSPAEASAAPAKKKIPVKKKVAPGTAAGAASAPSAAAPVAPAQGDADS
jgi:polyhydroxyalkanoate synthesis regulator phasin